MLVPEGVRYRGVPLYLIRCRKSFQTGHLATSMGGAYNQIMEINLVYTPPFLTVERVRETEMRFAMKLVVAQFCRAKDHDIIIIY